MNVMNYVIITPAHNEESFIQNTLNSVVAQTIQPEQWVIVDDGSSDGTVNIIQKYVYKNPWIKLIKNTPHDTKRQGGGKVVRAFMLGYKALEVSDFKFIVKLDADLTLPPSYFEEVGKAFKSDPMVGMCGGYLSVFSNGKWIKEKSASYHLRGAIKAYRKSCFEQIGGLRPVDNWDFLDEMTLMYSSWSVKILQLEVKHHRPTSTLINRGLKYSYKMGLIIYKDGYDLFLLALHSVPYGLGTKPYLLSSLALIMGFLSGCITRPQKDVNAEIEKFIRKFQYNRIRKYFERSADR
jgi:glycosyltransferase involved in cell wall biosynthesis